MPPHLPLEGFSTPADCAACRDSIRQGSHSFYLASRLLPAAVRQPAYATYAFCRMADDLIDREGGGADAIGDLAAMLDRIHAGRPGAGFVERGFADVVRRFAIPAAVPQALIEGLGWDAAGRRYETLEELESYAARVAGTVGVMMTLIMGERDARVLARACDLGVAMQLTNVVRDIGEDAGNGRIYMPLAWMREAGIDPDAWLIRPDYRPQVRRIAERLLDRAEALYARSLAGVAALPQGCRTGIGAARLLYREIGYAVRSGADPVASRATVSGWRKLALVAEAVAARPADRSDLARPALPCAAFLIAAVATAPAPRTVPVTARWWNLKARSERMLELLAGFSVRASAADAAAGRRYSAGQRTEARAGG